MREHYKRHGYARLSHAFPPESAAALADAVWNELSRRHGISRDDRTTWTVVEPRGLGALRRQRVFDALATPVVVAAITELLGIADWPPPFSWGDPLVTLPSTGRWTVPERGWHIDFPARSELRLKWLAYLAPVVAGGGGTVVLAGSHRRVAEFLRAHPDDPGRSATVRDVVLGGRSVRSFVDDVVELTGEPGDIVFLHPHLLHAPAPNHATEPRLMATGGLAG